MNDWNDAVAFGLTLPGVELAPHYGKPALKANGRAFVFTGREPDSFGISIDLDTIEMLKETDPETFWQTPHYEGWPGVLVRYGSRDPERVRAMIERAHGQALARKPPRSRKR